jgi:DNA repair photolyase
MGSKLPSKVKVEFGSSTAFFEVKSRPIPHILVENSQKKLHGWWPGKRECTAERMLINPYNGCTHSCSFCYAHAFWGYFQLYASQGIVTVFKGFDKAIARQLDSLDVASAGYLSPVTDPFQPINQEYHLSEKIIKVFIERNLPIEFITKGEISGETLDLIKSQPHSFGQVSILTVDEGLRKMLVPNGASTNKLFENMKRLAAMRIHAVCRIDPIIPLITDSDANLTQLIKKAAFTGAKHIVVSCLDIPKKTRGQVVNAFSKINPQVKAYYSQLYCEEIDGYHHANISYRKRLFSKLRNLCDKMGLTFALCMEYEIIEGKLIGLNSKFMSSTNCEGIDIPVYIRQNKKFVPAAICTGNCLKCHEAICGISDLAMGKEGSKKDWKFEDYRRWSRQIVHEVC